MDDNNQQDQSPQVYGEQSSESSANQTVVGGKPPKKTVPFFIGVIVVGIIVIGLILFAALSGGNSPTNTTQAPDPSNPVQPTGPQPAQPLDVEQASNAISEDLSSLNDDEDLPPEQLSDDNLDL